MVAVVTNIDVDHMETYEGDFSRLKRTFIDFLHNLPFYGLAVLCQDDPVVAEIIDDIGRPTLTYGLSEGADYRAVNVRKNKTQTHFEVLCAGRTEPLAIELNIPGVHNVLNATAVIAVAIEERKSTRLNSSHVAISYAVFCLKKKTHIHTAGRIPQTT